MPLVPAPSLPPVPFSSKYYPLPSPGISFGLSASPQATARWQYWDLNKWTDHPMSNEVEDCFQKGKTESDFLSYVIYIQEMIMWEKLTGYRRAMRRVPTSGTNVTADWLHIDENGEWVKYSTEVTSTLEDGHTKGYKLLCFHDSQPWIVDFQRMEHITTRGDKFGVARMVVIQDRLQEIGVTPMVGRITAETCSICFEEFATDSQRLVIQMSKCRGHAFHRDCIIRCIVSDSLKCPVCSLFYGRHLTGNQPVGSMTVETHPNSLPGHDGFGTIIINYNFPQQRQQANHPTPGAWIPADTRRCFLPDTPKGQDVLRLLRIAWERKLIFTVGISLTHGPSAGERIVWNGVHHKTQIFGHHGYPDPMYLDRVKEELEALGVQ